MSEPAESKTPDKALTDALRPFINAASGETPKSAKPERPDWLSLLALVVFAFDLAAILRFGERVVDAQLAQLLIKAVPVILGVTFFASVEAAQALVLRLARGTPFRLLVAAAFLATVAALFAPYRVLLKVSPEANLFVDRDEREPDSTPDSVTAITVHGLREHTIVVTEYDDSKSGKQVEDSVTIGAKQLLRALARRVPGATSLVGGYVIPIAIRSRVALAFPDTTTLVSVAGEFPDEFVEQSRNAHRLRERPGGGYELLIAEPRGFSTTVIKLPPGSYTLRYSSRRRCWSDRVSLVVFHGKNAEKDLSELPCKAGAL